MGLLNSLRLIFIIATVSANAVSKEHQILVEHAGEIVYYGEVVTTPCTISIGSQHQQVMMGLLRTNEFSGTGSWTAKRLFSIQFENCDESLTKSVSFIFEGNPDEIDPLVFKTESNTDEKNTGVGLGIFYENGELVIPNSLWSLKNLIPSEGNELNFIAKFRQTRQKINTGVIDAVVNFTVYYQ